MAKKPTTLRSRAVINKKSITAKKAVKKSAVKKKQAVTAEKAPEAGKYQKNINIEPGTQNPAADAVRKLRGATPLAEFAKACGLQHAPAISRVEREDYYSTTVKTLLQIAQGQGKKLIISFRDL